MQKSEINRCVSHGQTMKNKLYNRIKIIAGILVLLVSIAITANIASAGYNGMCLKVDKGICGTPGYSIVSAPMYNSEETVIFTLTNYNSFPVIADIDSFRIRNSAGSIVYDYSCTADCNMSMLSKSAYTISWNKKDNNNNLVPEGYYQGMIIVKVSSYNRNVYSGPFELGEYI